MEIAIIGLPQSGKTTVFNALTPSDAGIAGSRSPSREVHVGVAKVPEPRLDALAQMFPRGKIVQASVTYLDVPVSEGTADRGIAGRHLNFLQRVDAFLLVVRAFKDPAVAHPSSNVDPEQDASNMMEELAFSDLGIVERAMERRQISLKGAKVSEREAIGRDLALLTSIKETLEAEKAVRELELTSEQKRELSSYGLLTAKPLLVVFNIDEEDLADASVTSERLTRKYDQPGVRAMAMCCKLEAELAQLVPEEQEEFRSSLGAGESGSARVIDLSFALLDLVSFLTVGDDEVRAWPVPRGTPALNAAGKVHSDIERGFIRAEVVAFDDLAACGSLTETRRRGLLRLEGKSYLVQDGDVIDFLFNV